MKRVLVIGSSGSGKSTFARRLGEAISVPIIHLDKLYWSPNWVGTTDEIEWQTKVERALQGDTWIIDGNYSGTLLLRLQKADTVIFLDMPRVICVWRVVKRAAFYRKKTRPYMGADCDEKFDWKFLEFVRYVWNYPARSKPKVEKLLAQNQNAKTIVRLKSKKDVENFLQKL
jgi:adenylate kinase family enzyme